MRASVAVLVLALVGVWFTAATAIAQQQQPREPVVEAARQVTADSNPTRAYALPQIAVHPDDPSTAVIAVGEARGGGCSLFVTRDAGRSWQIAIEDMLPEGMDYCVSTDPGSYLDLTFAPDGTLYVVFFAASTEARADGGEKGVLLRTDDLGASHELSTFAERQPWTYEPDDGPAEDGRLSVRNPRVAVHPDDPEQVYVAAQRRGVETSAGFREADNRTHVTTSDDGGRNWSEATDLTNLVEEELDEEWVRTGTGNVAVAPDGTAYVIVNGDDTFFLLESTDDGENWEISEIGEGAAGAGGVAEAGLDAERGNLYVVWHERRGEDDLPPSHVYMYRSTDGGENWEELMNLTADEGPAGSNHYHPGLSVAPDGRIDVAWYDFRNDPGWDPDAPEGGMGTQETEEYWDVYLSSSDDGGQSWSPGVRVTDRSVPTERGTLFASYDLIGAIGVASSESAILLSWSDTRAGDNVAHAEDAYFTQVRRGHSAGQAAEAGAGSVSLLSGGLGAGSALVVAGLLLLLVMRAGRQSRRGSVDAHEGG